MDSCDVNVLFTFQQVWDRYSQLGRHRVMFSWSHHVRSRRKWRLFPCPVKKHNIWSSNPEVFQSFCFYHRNRPEIGTIWKEEKQKKGKWIKSSKIRLLKRWKVANIPSNWLVHVRWDYTLAKYPELFCTQDSHVSSTLARSIPSLKRSWLCHQINSIVASSRPQHRPHRVLQKILSCILIRISQHPFDVLICIVYCCWSYIFLLLFFNSLFHLTFSFLTIHISVIIS